VYPGEQPALVEELLWERVCRLYAHVDWLESAMVQDLSLKFMTYDGHGAPMQRLLNSHDCTCWSRNSAAWVPHTEVIGQG
jgi:hypothetical protein